MRLLEQRLALLPLAVQLVGDARVVERRQVGADHALVLAAERARRALERLLQAVAPPRRSGRRPAAASPAGGTRCRTPGRARARARRAPPPPSALARHVEAPGGVGEVGGVGLGRARHRAALRERLHAPARLERDAAEHASAGAGTPGPSRVGHSRTARWACSSARSNSPLRRKRRASSDDSRARSASGSDGEFTWASPTEDQLVPAARGSRRCPPPAAGTPASCA